MRRDTWIQVGAAVVLVVSLAASGVLTTQIAASAGRHRLTYADRGEEGDPPEVALGIAMGAFRGIFVNYLWIRANTLKEEGKYYEAVELANTITRLQPRFPRVWVFHAWNLAYNISVTTNTPQERWQWVQSGIRLLRDRGIPANPSDILLHKELAWIFMHKVQGIMDDANGYYKRRLAADWSILLGPPPRRTKECYTPEQMTEAYVAWLSKINGAADSVSELAAADPAVRPLVARLRTEAGLDLTGPLWDEAGNGPGERLLWFVEEQRSLQTASMNLEGVQLVNRRPGLNQGLVGIFDDTSVRDALRALVLHVRKRILIDKYKMEPDRMIRYTRDTGPLDWRHAAAHAYYWSTRGVDEALFKINQKNRGDFDILNTDRISIQSLQELYRSGEVYFDPFNPQFFQQLPNPDFIEAYRKILQRLVDRSMFVTEKGEVVYPDKNRPWSMYQAGYENFLKDAIRFLYRRGELARAEQFRQELLTSPRLNINRDPAEWVTHLSSSLDRFVEHEIAADDRFTSPYVAASEVTAALQSAFLTGLLGGNTDLFKHQYEYARNFHKRFVDQQVFDVSVTRQSGQARMEVMDRDFPAFAGKVLAGLIVFAGIPDGPIMYAKAPTELKVHAYPLLAQSEVRTTLEAAEKAGGAGFDTWFQPPPGMENYLKELDQKRQEAEKTRGTLERK